MAERELLLSNLESTDELVRASAVGSLCPCSHSWELFEQHIKTLSRLTKDSSRAVRRKALHVFDDAVNIQSIGDAEYRFQSVEDMLRKKRAPRFGSEKVEVRRTGRFKKRKGRFVLR